jgi:GNAT superfamily N-acetyltransferase
LIAWLGGQPVGHVLLRWDGPAEADLAARLAPLGKHPLIGGLDVHPDYRSRGIGSGLMAAAEKRARQRNQPRIGLLVGVENVRARALYERLGYTDAGLGPCYTSWSYIGPDGRWRTEGGCCIYLVKELAAQ